MDGNAVLQFIYGFVRKELSELRIIDRHAYFIRQDLFLLENQILFQVLKLVTESFIKYILFGRMSQINLFNYLNVKALILLDNSNERHDEHNIINMNGSQTLCHLVGISPLRILFRNVKNKDFGLFVMT